jgi:effector-binding domain-containing protein
MGNSRALARGGGGPRLSQFRRSNSCALVKRRGALQEMTMLCHRVAVSLAIAAAAFGFLASTPAHAQAGRAQSPAPVPAPAQPAPVQPADPFGEEVTLTAKPILFLKGQANWDAAYETLVDAYKTIFAYTEKEGIKPAGPPMTIYTEADDTGFHFQAAVPIAEPPKIAPRGDLAVGTSPAGRALKFVHRGSYDSMDSTYENITNFLDEKRLEAQDLFIEEYITDPVKTPEDKLVIHVLVPIK